VKNNPAKMQPLTVRTRLRWRCAGHHYALIRFYRTSYQCLKPEPARQFPPVPIKVQTTGLN